MIAGELFIAGVFEVLRIERAADAGNLVALITFARS
jgi:hypothetical protein